jgi:DNA-binding transcriptional MerR regulator
MNIGEVSKRADISSKMVRRYEEQGIIPDALRLPLPDESEARQQP